MAAAKAILVRLDGRGRRRTSIVRGKFRLTGGPYIPLRCAQLDVHQVCRGPKKKDGGDDRPDGGSENPEHGCDDSTQVGDMRAAAMSKGWSGSGSCRVGS